MSRWRQMSLRARLGLLYVALLMLSIAIVGGYSYWNIHQLLIYNTTSHIRAQAKPIIEHWLNTNDTLSFRFKVPRHITRTSDLPLVAKSLAYDLTSRNRVALILDQVGHVLANGKRLPEEPQPPRPDRRYYSLALKGANEINYQTSANGEPTLVLLIPIRPTAHSQTVLGVAQISTPLKAINEILLWHGIMLGIVGLFTLIIGGGLGFSLISSALKGLKKMVDTCQNISSGDFSQRVHFPNRHDEIGRLAQAFDNMVDRIQATFESQRLFVANAAHELRTPLTALQGSLEVLLRGSQDDPAAVARLSRGMYQEVKRLIRLCEQLLGLTRLDNSANIQKEPLNLEEFFDTFMQQTKLLSKDRQVVLEKGEPVTIMADADFMSQILFNFFNNAIQHTQSDTITLGWHLIPGYVKIWIADTGEGISPDELPHIFEPFYQGKSSFSRHHKGAGLGLSLAKAMIEAHHGHLKVTSEFGQGTTFIFTLPLN